MYPGLPIYMVLNLIPNRLRGILCVLSDCSVCFETVSASEPEGLSRIGGICILDSELCGVGTFYDHISSFFFFLNADPKIWE